MPAKPPPMTVTESRRSRSGPGGSSEAWSKLEMRRSRIATASSIVLRPIALSATPGIGKVRETAPAVTTMWSYSISHESSVSEVIVAVLLAWSMPDTLAVMMFVWCRCRRCATTACRASIEPAATSGRNG